MSSNSQSQNQTNALSLQSLEACKAATDKYTSVINQNIAIQKINEQRQIAAREAKILWDAERKIIKDRHKRWADTSDEYDKWKMKSYSKTFNTSCYDRPGPSICFSDLDKDDNNCINAAKALKLPFPEGYYDTGVRNGCNTLGFFDLDQGPPGCVRGQTRQCARSQESIDAANADWIRNEPLVDIQKSEPKYGETGPYDDLPYIPNEGIIQCCANFVNIGNGNATDVNQSCSQRVDQLIQNIKMVAAEEAAEESSKPKPGPNPDPNSGPSPNPGPNPNPNPNSNSGPDPVITASQRIPTWLTLLIIAIICLLIISVIGSCGYVFLKKKPKSSI